MFLCEIWRLNLYFCSLQSVILSNNIILSLNFYSIFKSPFSQIFFLVVSFFFLNLNLFSFFFKKKETKIGGPNLLGRNWNDGPTQLKSSEVTEIQIQRRSVCEELWNADGVADGSVVQVDITITQGRSKSCSLLLGRLGFHRQCLHYPLGRTSIRSSQACPHAFSQQVPSFYSFSLFLVFIYNALHLFDNLSHKPHYNFLCSKWKPNVLDHFCGSNLPPHLC